MSSKDKSFGLREPRPELEQVVQLKPQNLVPN